MSALPLQFLSSPGQVAALVHPMRLKILETLREPDSATGIAKRLGLGRQQVNYHLRELESQGLVELVSQRRRRNCMERILRATATSYLVDPQTLGSLGADPEKVVDRFSSTYLIALLARAIRELAGLRARADEAGKQLPTLSLQADVRFASPAAQHAFAEELTAAVAALVARHQDDSAPGGRTFRLLVGAHPAPAPEPPGLDTSPRINSEPSP